MIVNYTYYNHCRLKLFITLTLKFRFFFGVVLWSKEKLKTKNTNVILILTLVLLGGLEKMAVTDSLTAIVGYSIMIVFYSFEVP